MTAADEVVMMTTQEHGEIIATPPHVDFEREDAPKHECGYVEGTFACRIRHLQMNTGFAKAYEDFR